MNAALAVGLLVAQALAHAVVSRWRRTYRPRNQLPSRRDPKPGRLRCVSINVWSGSTYTGELSLGSGFAFGWHESAAQREARYHSLVSGLRELDADIVAVTEAMPAGGYARRLARDLGMDCVHSEGIAGLLLGWLRFPFISEGDAILARRGCRLRYAGRARLTGGVFSPTPI